MPPSPTENLRHRIRGWRADALSSPVTIARFFFVLIATGMMALIAWESKQGPFLFSVLGFLGALVFILIEYSTKAISSRKIVIAMVGFLIGMIFGEVFYPTFHKLAALTLQFVEVYRVKQLSKNPIPAISISLETARFICNLTFGYFGLVLALRHADWLRIGNLKLILANPSDRPKVLDSSAIIDGRVLDVINLKIFDGPILVPNFVLTEVQGLADSPDAHRRARGRRGLEVLDKLRSACKSLDVINTDYPGVAQVDQKLVTLCREIRGDLVTNDYNLQKVAQLQQIQTMNINELADALRPTVYIGELLSLKIVKSGKEPGQGVGYLDDGTMVVVDNADRLVGKDCEIVVSSILQNPSGRLIFGRVTEDARQQAQA